jgi:hypothetical protein
MKVQEEETMVATIPLYTPEEIASLHGNRAVLWEPGPGVAIHLVALLLIGVGKEYTDMPVLLQPGSALMIREITGRTVVVGHPAGDSSSALGATGKPWSPKTWVEAGLPVDMWAVARPLLAALEWLDEEVSDSHEYDVLDHTRVAGAKVGHDLAKAVSQVANLKH